MENIKGYLITKISDQKDRKYQFYRDLEVNEDGLPTDEALDSLVANERQEKSVALFIGDEYMTMFCFKSISKFNRKVLSEYSRNYEESNYDKVYWYTTEKNAKAIKCAIDDLKEQYYRQELIRGDEEVLKNGGYIRK